MISPMPGTRQIHGRDGFAVGVELHIERLDLLRVIGDKDRALEDLLGEVALMLGLQIAAPEDLDSQTRRCALRGSRRPRCRCTWPKSEVMTCVQALEQALVHELVEELPSPPGHGPARSAMTYLIMSSASFMSSVRSANAISGSIIQNSAAWRGGVGIFGAEGRAEGIDVAEGHARTFRR